MSYPVSIRRSVPCGQEECLLPREDYLFGRVRHQERGFPSGQPKVLRPEHHHPAPNSQAHFWPTHNFALPGNAQGGPTALAPIRGSTTVRVGMSVVQQDNPRVRGERVPVQPAFHSTPHQQWGYVPSNAPTWPTAAPYPPPRYQPPQWGTVPQNPYPPPATGWYGPHGPYNQGPHGRMS